jgi:hypothetical protein
MSVDGTMQISYCLQEKERLFALAYGVYTNRSGVLQKGKKAESFPRLLRKSRLSAAALLAVMGLYVVLMAVQGVDALGVVVLAIAGVYAVGLVRSQKTQKRNYEYALQRFMESGETEGVLHFDQRGITDVAASGEKKFFSWQDFRQCLLVGEGILFMFSQERDAVLMIDRSEEKEAALREILKAMDKEDTIRTVEVKGETK